MNRATAPARDGEIDLVELARSCGPDAGGSSDGASRGRWRDSSSASASPRRYTVTVKLAPEVQGRKPSLGGLGSLASMAGIGWGA